MPNEGRTHIGYVAKPGAAKSMKHKKSRDRQSARALNQKIRKSRAKSLNLPGEGRYCGDAPSTAFKGTLFRYNQTQLSISDVNESTPLPEINSGQIHWLQIKGLTAISPIEAICHQLNIHPLSIEDIFNTYHPAKYEEFPDYLLLISKYFVFDSVGNNLEVHHLAMVLKDDVLVTFQDSDLPVFDHLIARLQTEGSRIRKSAVDYLFYRLLDIILDHNFLTIDSIWDKVDALDDAIMHGVEKDLAIDIQNLKREMILFIKSLRPIRKSVNTIVLSGSPRYNQETRVFFRDLQDHISEIMELAETTYAYLIESHNLYLSVLSQKTNETMKVLTSIATIFIPLTFIVGVYGMNFRHMPELNFPYAYPLLWGIMIGMSLLMIRYFKKKNWF